MTDDTANALGGRGGRTAMPTIITRREMIDIHVRLATLDGKLDQVLEVKTALSNLQQRITVLEMERASGTTRWAFLAGLKDIAMIAAGWLVAAWIAFGKAGI